MSNNELNLLVTKMGEAVKENLNKFKRIWIICNIIITFCLIILSIYIYYSYKQIDELRVNLDKVKNNFTINHAPQKINHTPRKINHTPRKINHTPRKINRCFRYKSK